MASKKKAQPHLDSRKLALALVQVVQMWSNRRRYESFLLCSRAGKLEEKWFKWFSGSWKVARTIKDGKQTRVREYLDRDFRRLLNNGGGAELIDATAQHIQQQGWSSAKRKDGRSSLPISLVSKVAFFLSPTKFVPYDKYARKGLNLLRRDVDERVSYGCSYSEFLVAFEKQYARFEPQLKAALKERWVVEIAGKLGCPTVALTTTAMRRKLFDDYLMHSADYQA